MKDSKLMEEAAYLQRLKSLHQDQNIQCYSVFLMKTIWSLLRRESIHTIFDIGSGSGDNSDLLVKQFSASDVYSFDYVL